MGEGVFFPPHRGRLLARAAITLAFVVSVGTAGFTWIEGWSILEAVYFTLITVTTVGYGDEGISDAGRYFALVLLIGGIGVASWSFSTLVQGAVSNEIHWKNRMQKIIGQLRQHSIVCGYGRIGQIVAQELRAAGHDVVVIERNPDRLREALERELPVVEGSASEEAILQLAGIEHAKNVISVVDAEVENIVITLSARGLRNDIHIIARAEAKEDESKLYRAGANQVVSPFFSGGREIATSITNPGVAEFLSRSRCLESNVTLAEIRIGANGSLVGRSLRDFGQSEGTRISFVALERPGEETQIPPPGSLELRANDLLIVAGDPVQIQRMSREARGRAAA